MEKNCIYKVSRKQSNAYGNWICPFCKNVFRTRRLLNEHKKICDCVNESVQKYIIDENGKRKLVSGCAWNKGLTKETNTIVKNVASKLSKLYKGKPGHKHSEESKKKLSKIRKKQIKENGGIWWNSRSKCKRSYAEEWTKKILENEVKDNTFVEEFHIGRWFLDFAWPHKKIYIEIDGSQHEWPERKQNDIIKDKYCCDLGWKCLRLKWKDVCNNTQEAIKIIKNFVLTSEIIEPNFKYKSKKELAKEKAIENKKIRKIKLDEMWEERKNKILNSGVDLKKYGWIEKVSLKIGYTTKIIKDTVNHFKKDFEDIIFKRK